MFWTIFLAALLALTVFHIIKTPELLALTRQILKRILIVSLSLGLIIGIITLVIYYRKTLLIILGWLLAIIIVLWIMIDIKFIIRKISNLIKNKFVIIPLSLGLIFGLIVLLMYYPENLLIILGLLLAVIIVGGIMIGFWSIPSYKKYIKRKKLGLIKDGIKYSKFMNENFEKERYDKLSKEQREIEDDRASKGSIDTFYYVIPVPVLWFLTIVIFLLLK